MHEHSHEHGCGHCHAALPADSPRYRRVLWIALVVNAAMFLVEIAAGFEADSSSLLADSIDFAGDAANYGLSLMVLSLAAVWRSRTALLKGACMLAFGLFVATRAVWMAWQGVVPEAATMGAIGLLALAANVGVAVLLYRYREGDANMRSVWLCTRNDAIGNLAVMLAAGMVFVTGRGWADAAVAVTMAVLALTSGWSVVRQARRELHANRLAKA